jgi:hypothetical protein
MRRYTKTRLQIFLDKLRAEYKRCIRLGHYTRASQIMAYLATHREMIGTKSVTTGVN